MAELTTGSETGWIRRCRRSLGPLVRGSMERVVLGPAIQRRLPRGSRGVALTFDDGPDPENTPRILDILADHGAVATFFVMGRRAMLYPEIIRRMLREGHLVGNHSFNHVVCEEVRHEQFWSEIFCTDTALYSISPELRHTPFRPPYGLIKPLRAWELSRLGRPVILWSVDSQDYQLQSPEPIVELGQQVQDRDIVLLHDRFDITVEALPKLLQKLRERELPTLRAGGDFNRADRATAPPL